jgi:hypothetical protein
MDKAVIDSSSPIRADLKMRPKKLEKNVRDTGNQVEGRQVPFFISVN